MIRLCLRSETTYKFLRPLKWIGRFFFFDLSRLDRVSDKAVFVSIVDTIGMPNGTFKTTRVDRFKSLNEILVPRLEKSVMTSIHDVAASDGITSYELWNALQEAGVQAEMTVSDKYFKLLEYRKFGTSIYTTESGDFISARFGPIDADPKLGYTFVASRLLGRIASRIALEQKHDREILLINPALRPLLATGQIRAEQKDIFLDNGEVPHYHLVRCMNILNAKYFSQAQISQALKNIKDSLREGGFLLIGRTDIKTGLNFATLFRLEEGRFAEIESMNGGSEVKHLVVDS